MTRFDLTCNRISLAFVFRIYDKEANCKATGVIQVTHPSGSDQGNSRKVEEVSVQDLGMLSSEDRGFAGGFSSAVQESIKLMETLS
jgi:hypothetical protein